MPSRLRLHGLYVIITVLAVNAVIVARAAVVHHVLLGALLAVIVLARALVRLFRVLAGIKLLFPDSRAVMAILHVVIAAGRVISLARMRSVLLRLADHAFLMLSARAVIAPAAPASPLPYQGRSVWMRCRKQ